jgi:hypothetical protein
MIGLIAGAGQGKAFMIVTPYTVPEATPDIASGSLDLNLLLVAPVSRVFNLIYRTIPLIICLDIRIYYHHTILVPLLNNVIS